MSDCPTQFTIASWLAGDLPADRMAQIGAHLESCPSCRAYQTSTSNHMADYGKIQDDQLEKLKAAMDDLSPVASVTQLSPRSRSHRIIGTALMAAAAAVLLVLVVPWGEKDSVPDPAGAITYKGSGAFSYEVVAKRGQSQFRVESGTKLAPNDALRFVVTTGKPTWLCVFSMTPGGEPAAFYPETPPEDDPAPLHIDSSGRHELPGSVVLDQSSGDEYLILLHSNKPFERGAITEAIVKMDPRSIDGTVLEGVTVHVLPVKKLPAIR